MASSLTTYEFEGLEGMEVDPSALQELLYGPGEGGQSGEEAMEEERGGNDEESVGVGVESWWCFDECKDSVGNLEWPDDVMEEETCNEMAVWSAEEVSGGYEFLAFPPNGVVCDDDIGYIGLWQDS